MKENRLHYPIRLMAKVLQVSRAGYYAWCVRKPSRRARTDVELSVKIREVHELSRRTYGPRRIQAELAAEGMMVGRDRIGRLRKRMGLFCVQKRKFKATTDSKHDLPIAANVVNQQFATVLPGQVWGADITYIPTDEGWMYLAGVKDFGSREIVGWAMAERMSKQLARDALKKARAFRTPLPGCIHHSDRGSQYCSRDYRRDLQIAGFIVSMSRKGNCYDNAPTESLWGSLKQELIYHRRFTTREEARTAVQEYIEVFYNRVRRHSAIGNVAPSRYAESFYHERASA